MNFISLINTAFTFSLLLINYLLDFYTENYLYKYFHCYKLRCRRRSLLVVAFQMANVVGRNEQTNTFSAHYFDKCFARDTPFVSLAHSTIP